MKRTCETCRHSTPGMPDRELLTSWIGSRKPPSDYWARGRTCGRAFVKPFCVLAENTCSLWSKSGTLDLLEFLFAPHYHASRLRRGTRKMLDTLSAERDAVFVLRSASFSMWETLESFWRGVSVSSLPSGLDESHGKAWLAGSELTVGWARQRAGNTLRALRAFSRFDPEIFRDLGIDNPKAGPQREEP